MIHGFLINREFLFSSFGFWLVASTDLNFFLKNIKIRWKRIPRPQNEWFWVIWWSFSTLACLTCFCGSITFPSFLKLILVWFWCFSTHFKAYDLLYKNLKNFATRGPIRHLKMAKCVQKSVKSAILRALETFSGNLSSDSCRAGHKLQNEYSNIKIGQELTSEIRKMWGNLKMLISQNLNKVSKFQAHMWNQHQNLHKIDVVL